MACLFTFLLCGFGRYQDSPAAGPWRARLSRSRRRLSRFSPRCFSSSTPFKPNPLHTFPAAPNCSQPSSTSLLSYCSYEKRRRRLVLASVFSPPLFLSSHLEPKRRQSHCLRPFYFMTSYFCRTGISAKSSADGPFTLRFLREVLQPHFT